MDETPDPTSDHYEAKDKNQESENGSNHVSPLLHESTGRGPPTQPRLQKLLHELHASESGYCSWNDTGTFGNKSDIAMLDSLMARLRGDAEGGLTAIAKEIGITKGAASKVAQRLKKRVGG
jgi:hypothetical protein